MLALILTDLLERFYRARPRPLSIVEIGTTYLDERWPVGLSWENRSTVAMAEWMNRFVHMTHSLLSVDVNATHIAICKSVLEKKNLRHLVQFQETTGLEALSMLPFHADFILLDAASNAEVTLSEYRMALSRINNDAIIVIDDAYKPLNVNKARLAWPEAEKAGLLCRGLRNQAVAIATGPLSRWAVQEATK